MSRQNPGAPKKVWRIDIVDAASHKTVWSRRGTKSTLSLIISAFAVLFIAIIYALIAYTPIRTTIPGYPDAKTKRMAIQNAIELKGIQCRVMSAINVPQVCEPYLRRKAVKHMEENIVTIFAGSQTLRMIVLLVAAWLSVGM